MFEEICLVCGKHLFDYGSAYCSDDCQGRDATSPSISSSSSALSSPHLGYTNGGDVPPLMPSALGLALKNVRGRDPYTLPSSAASTTWSSMGTDDDEDDGASLAVRAEHSDGSELAQDGNPKQPNYQYPLKPSALQYTRRPSGTNNHSTVPHVHKRMSSSTSSSSGHVRGIPRSAPPLSHSSTEDDEVFSDFGLSSRENLDTEESDAPSDKGSDGGQVKPADTEKAKRTRNRASLPAYFSLLQFSLPGKGDPRLSPVSSSSGRTVARPSPPTPKMTLRSQPPPQEGNMPFSIHTTPRGRRRVPAESSSSRRSDSSRSHSRAQQEAEIIPRMVERDLRPRFDGKQCTDWSSVPGQPVRGRTAFRRNSSPPPKALLGMEDRGRTLAVVRQAEIFDRSRSGSRNCERPRGRTRVEDLDGFGCSTQAPGFGNGRSGLLGRERDRERERSLGFVSRVPL